MAKSMSTPVQRPEATTLSQALTTTENPIQQAVSTNSSEKMTLEKLAEKVDACLDAVRELIKSQTALTKELAVSKKAGKF